MPKLPLRSSPSKPTQQLAMQSYASGMLRANTPVEDYTEQYGLFVKREDLSCPKPGPPFSKTRGVYEHIRTRPENLIGVLDTYHSQAGHAVARACQVLGKKCVNFYPNFKYEPGPREPQQRAVELGAELVALPAGRSAILFHQAKKVIVKLGGYMMPNALKLDESVAETAKEARDLTATKPYFKYVLLPASSGTIAAGVIKGIGIGNAGFIIHLGYSRSHDEVLRYLEEKTEVALGIYNRITIIDEEYAYKDKARPGPTPPWPCNEYYDLKAFRWWVANRSKYPGRALLWNIG